MIGIKNMIPRMLLENAELTTVENLFFDGMILALKTWVLTGAHETKTAEIERPVSWWDHFKQDKFPGWAKKIWPAKYECETVFQPKNIYVCPHANIEWPDEKHFEFISKTEAV